MRRVFLVCLAAASAVANAQSTGDTLLPGAWEEEYVIEVTEIEGEILASPTREATRETVCYSVEDVRDFPRLMSIGAEDVCVTSGFEMEGGVMSMSMRCEFAPGVVLEGDAVGSYTSSTYELLASMRTAEQPGFAATASMQARRVGQCAS